MATAINKTTDVNSELTFDKKSLVTHAGLSDEVLAREFHKIFEHETQPECKEFLKYPNDNRSKNIKCRDDTRVTLSQKGKLQPDKKYIHANIVDGAMSTTRDKKAYQQKYIITQLPLESTKELFWQMVFEKQAKEIVFLSPSSELDEQSFVKSEYKYMKVSGPGFTDATDIHAAMSYTAVHEKSNCSGVLLQMKNWPKDGVPTVEGFLNFLYVVHHFGKGADEVGLGKAVGKVVVKDGAKKGAVKPREEYPVIVCSEFGAGRAGTFVAIDTAFKELSNSGRVNLFKIVKNLRQQRTGAIVNEKQYIFCYKVLAEFIKSEPKNDKSEALNRLYRPPYNYLCATRKVLKKP